MIDYYVYIKVLMIVEYDNINMDKYDEQHSLYWADATSNDW